MITFEEYLNERVYKGLKANLTKGKKKVTEEELRELIKTKNKNKELENLDVSEITDMSRLFQGMDYGKWVISDIDDWDTSNVTDMSIMFNACSSLTEAPEFKDTSNVTNMRHMFDKCSSLTKAPKFKDTSKVENMRDMFYNCSSLTEAPEFKDTSNVTNMINMFTGCTKLTNGDMSNWDVSKVKTNRSMFHNCPFPDDKKPKFKD